MAERMSASVIPTGAAPDVTPAEVASHMFAADRASRGMGMRIVEVGDGRAELQMTVRADMLNGVDICHGGFITTLADSAFAFACNSSNQLTVAAGLTVDFLASAREGDVLTARALKVSSAGRTGVYDIVVDNQRGERVALVRGRSHALHGRRVIEDRAVASDDEPKTSRDSNAPATTAVERMTPKAAP
jgi:acyl-CoA thioesterase